MNDKLRVLIIGDVVGRLGCSMFKKHVSILKDKYSINSVIVNGENSHQSGKGITPSLVQFFKNNGANVVTSGNHIWARKEIYPYLNENSDLLRPANFPKSCPGVGVTTFNCGSFVIGVINLQGRIFMREMLEDPFKTAESLLAYLKPKTNIIFVDFHAEATSEKNGMGYFLDGRVTCLYGTHSHVQTSDERILTDGTAYISDVGMAGALNSMIGMKKGSILQSFLTQMPTRFEVDENPPALLNGILVDLDPYSGKAQAIERIKIIDENISISEEL